MIILKKNLAIVLCAVLCGGIITFGVVLKINSILKIDDKNIITVFQVGVYENKVNALSMAKKYRGIVHKDDIHYRVYIAAYQNEDIINKMQNYYNKQNVYYYLKKIKTDENFVITLNKYEKLLMNSHDDAIYDNLNNLLVTKLEEYL